LGEIHRPRRRAAISDIVPDERAAALRDPREIKGADCRKTTPALDASRDAEAGPLEEHLLICAACRERLDETAQYAAAIRAAALEIGAGTES
jgi:hypothetical protein